MIDHSPLCRNIISYIQTVACSKVGKTYSGFPHLLSLLFKRYRVNVNGK